MNERLDNRNVKRLMTFLNKVIGEYVDQTGRVGIVEAMTWLDDMYARRAVIEWGEVPQTSDVHKKFFRTPQGDVALEASSPGLNSFRIVYGEDLVT